MLKNYFLVALRTFRRNKTFSFINIIGLAIGISASLVIYLLVQFDFSFDKFEKDSARIYRVTSHGKNQGGAWQYPNVSEPMGAAAKKEVAGLEIIAPFHTLDETRVTIPFPNPNDPAVFRKQKDVIVADANYFNLLNYTWLAGSAATTTNNPYEVVLTEKNAKLYYANTKYPDIIGKHLFLDDTVQCTIPATAIFILVRFSQCHPIIPPASNPKILVTGAGPIRPINSSSACNQIENPRTSKPSSQRSSTPTTSPIPATRPRKP